MSVVAAPVRTRSLARAHARARVDARAALAYAVPVAVVGGTALDKGGYFPTAWGWSALALTWTAALALLVRPRIAVSALEARAVAAFAALAVWVFASRAWSESPTRTMLEGERTLVYLALLVAVVLVAERASVPLLAGGLLGATVVACGWGLLTRLLPDRIGTYDEIARDRLASPIGYWNALGAFAAIATLLALGLAARATTARARAAAAAALPVVLTTLYFTFGRGAWIALAAGIGAAVALDGRRLQLIGSGGLAAVPAAIAIWLASRSSLGHVDRTLAVAAHDGHRLLVELVLLVALTAGAAVASVRLERKIALPPDARRVAGVGVVAVAATVAAIAISSAGSPAAAVRHAYHQFTSTPPVSGPALGHRLFSLSGNGRARQWRVAWREFRAHPVAGTGAGTYELHWLQDRPTPYKVRDTHNLYLETLGELGVVGLALLVAALAAPVAAAVAARRHPLAPALLGAYCVFLVHALADWDWEVPAVTGAAVAVGAALLALARPDDAPTVLRGARRLAAVGVAAVGAAAFVGLLGNVALARSDSHARSGDWRGAATWARRAHRYAPWSATPLEKLGLAQPTARLARPYLAQAVAKEPRDWRLRLELAWASKGNAQRRALADALRLNPLSPEVRQFRGQLPRSSR